MSTHPTRVVANIGVHNRALWTEFLATARRLDVRVSVALARGARMWLDSLAVPPTNDWTPASFVDPAPAPDPQESDRD